MGFVAAGTWKSSKEGIVNAAACLAKGMSALDALEQGIKIVEEDPHANNVGLGSYPNLDGECELDAAIMCGASLANGAVMGLRGFRNPISIARRLMESTPHTILAGAGAEAFAFEQGFKKEPVFYEEVYRQWFAMRQKYLAEGIKFPPLDACTSGRFEEAEEEAEDEGLHDTVGMVAMDQKGDICAATSTSGLALKMPGRIGDSPIIGSGFYADNRAGAATATGVGEDIMRGCISFLAVQFMALDMPAQQAAEKAMEQTHGRLAKLRKGDQRVGKMAIICADKNGGIGAAANHDTFDIYFLTDKESLQLFHAPQVR